MPGQAEAGYAVAEHAPMGLNSIKNEMVRALSFAIIETSDDRSHCAVPFSDQLRGGGRRETSESLNRAIGFECEPIKTAPPVELRRVP